MYFYIIIIIILIVSIILNTLSIFLCKKKEEDFFVNSALKCNYNCNNIEYIDTKDKLPSLKNVKNFRPYQQGLITPCM